MVLLRAFWRYKISLILFVILASAGIGFFTKEANATCILFIPALYVVFQVRGKYIFFSRLENEYPEVAVEMGITIPKKANRSTLFKMADILMIIAFSAMLFFFSYKLIF